jgi:hypothetical protein
MASFCECGFLFGVTPGVCEFNRYCTVPWRYVRRRLATRTTLDLTVIQLATPLSTKFLDPIAERILHHNIGDLPAKAAKRVIRLWQMPLRRDANLSSQESLATTTGCLSPLS